MLRLRSSALLVFFTLFVLSFAQTTTTQTQTITQTTTITATNPRIYAPVCVGDTRFLTTDIARIYYTQGSLNNLGLNVSQTRSCEQPRLRGTVTGSLKSCNCPLIDYCTRIPKKNDSQYLNPCFAKCEHPDTVYKDYKRCDHKFLLRNILTSASSSSNNGRLVTSNLYINQSCPHCINVGYNPVCINGVEFSNSCYALCYQPTGNISSCSVSYGMTQTSQNSNTCVCIADVNPVCVNERRYMNECLAQCDFPGVISRNC